MNRRNLLTAAASVMLPGAVRAMGQYVQAPDIHPDADLLEACAAYQAMEASRPVATGQAEKCGTPECDEHEAAQEVITERANEMVHELADMPAVTREGMQAKARAILLWDGGNSLKGEPDDYSGDRLMASLLRDLLAGRRGHDPRLSGYGSASPGQAADNASPTVAQSTAAEEAQTPTTA